MSWVHTKFATALKFYNGKAGTVNEAGTYPVYGSNGIIGYCEEPLFENAIIIGRVGAYCGAILYCNGKFWASDNTIVVKPTAGYDVVFLSYLLRIMNLNQFAGGSAQPLLTHGWIKPIAVKMPPLPIQQKIAGILAAYDDLIENNLKRIKLLEEMAQITYEEWFVRLRFPNHESTPINPETGLPEGWKMMPFGDKYKTASGGTPSRKQEALYFDNGTIPWIRTQELRNTLIIEPLVRITEAGLKNSSAKIFPANTVLLAMYGNTIGETALLRIPASTNQACCAFLTQEHESYFIYQYLILNKNLVLGYRMGAAQENISQEIIKSIKVLNPTDDLIRAYADIVRPIYNGIENLMLQSKRLREARDILLPRLMTGVIDVESYDPTLLLKEAS